MTIVSSWMRELRNHLHIGRIEIRLEKIETKLEQIENVVKNSVIEEAAKGRVLLENVELEMAKGRAVLTNDQKCFEVRLGEIEGMISRLILAVDSGRRHEQNCKEAVAAEVAALTIEMKRLTGIIEQHFESAPHGYEK